MKRVLVVTHSSEGGLNFLQMMEVVNLLGGKGLQIETSKNPMNIQNDQLKEAEGIIMIVPEWNGSFPFSYKELIDSSGYPSRFKGKKVLLIGTSETDFGNVMGITHLQHILEWIGAEVFNKRICIPRLSKKFEDNNIKVDERLEKAVNNFVNNF